MNEIMAIWAEWIKPSAGLPTVQWSHPAGAGRRRRPPGATATPACPRSSAIRPSAPLPAWPASPARAWPLQGIGLFLLELGVAVVLFEAGGRIPLRWFRHNPMVLVQSVAESALTFFGVYWLLRPDGRAGRGGRIAGAGGHGRVAGRAVARGDRHARRRPGHRAGAGAVHAEHPVRADAVQRPRRHAAARRSRPVEHAAIRCWWCWACRWWSARCWRWCCASALRVMSPTSENTAILLLALIAAGAALAAQLWRLGAAGGAAGRHAAQAAQPAPLVLAAADGHGLVAADHADVRAGVGRGGAGRLEPARGRPGAGAGGGAHDRQGGRRGAGQCRQRRQLEAGLVGRLRHVAHVVGGAAAGVAVSWPRPARIGRQIATSPCRPSC